MSSRRESDVARLEKLLREANERIEQERRPAEDERRSRKEAEDKAEEEQRNRQVADERAELERRRAEDERRNREEADERAEVERRRAEDERRNREEADERAEVERQRTEEAESRAHIEEIKTRRTTFEEYIRTCHTLLSKPLRVQTDMSLSTQGSITSPKNRRCPTLLKP
jgi:hypothetical protein